MRSFKMKKQMEITEENELNNDLKTNAEDIIFEILSILRDYYFASFTLNENRLFVKVKNGQEFVITVDEKK